MRASGMVVLGVDGHGNGLRLRLPRAVGQHRDGTLWLHAWHGPASAAG